MAITLNNPELEDRLARLGRKQRPRPLSKTAMAELILYEHTRDLRRAHTWKREEIARVALLGAGDGEADAA